MSLNIMDKNNFKELAKKFFEPQNKQKSILIFGIIGIILILVSSLFKSDKEISKSCNAAVSKSTMDQKREKLEANLENIISNIDGAGKTKIFITFESDCETVYATEEKKNKEESEDKSGDDVTRKKECNDSEKKFITVRGSDGSEQALAITELEPKIKGAVVICSGADDPIVKSRIVEAVTTALNTTSNRVCVTKSN